MSTFSLLSIYSQLTSFAKLENFWSLFNTAFGSSYDFATAATLRSQWQGGNFSLFPPIEVVSSDVLGTANGAYGISTNRIYLSDAFISSASQQSLEAVILEEFGHFVDAQINQTDTPGDEGELFSALVRGVSLSAAELGRIKAEDDHAVIVVNGQSVAVEQATTLVGVWDRLSYAIAVTVVGNYAYAVGDTLEIIDISDPSNPIFKGGYDIINSGRDIQIVGNYAYIVNNSGLQIIDISNPTAPTLKGSYNTFGSYGVQVVGNYAYVADWSSGLQIIDISNPTAPTLKGSYNTFGTALGVSVVGNYAYVANGFSGLQIIDISNPTVPIFKGSYDTPSSANDVQVVGNYAYVADGSSGLQIIDISNPTVPIFKGSYDTPSSANDVQVVGNYAYVADGSSGLQIIDISNPTVPIFKGSYDTPSSANDVQVISNHAYVADNFSGLQIIDISNPTIPTLKGDYDAVSSYNVQVVGNFAYTADRSTGLKIIDISNPNVPIFKGSYDTSNSANDVQVVGDFAYIADRSGLLIIDISNPITPILKGSYITNPNGSNYGYTDIHVVGNYAYLAETANSGRLSIIDISNPTSPILKGSSSGNTATRNVQVVGNYAYTANFSNGLRIIDITNPTAPTLKGSYDTAGWARGVSVVGNYAYVADDNSGLQIIDISNPTAPIFKGNYDTPGNAQGVQVVGNYAYIADGSSGLQIIDISNPTAPILQDSYNTTGNALGVSVVGNYAYVADEHSGLQIIDVSEFIPLNQSPSDLSLSNSTIAENQAVGTAVGTFTTTDPDTGNTFTYSLVTGTGDTDNTLFAISGNQLQSNGIFDFENKNSYSIRVRTTDQGGLTFEKQLTIGVTNLNETPIDLTLSNTSIAENQAVGTAVGTLTTTDPDIGNTFTYSLVTGTGSTDNALFTLVGNQLQSNGIFDFETKNSYSIRVRTTDQGGLTFEKQLTIGVTNLNETPIDLTLSNTSIAENQAVGTAVGTFTTTDPDTGNTFTYSLVTGTGDTDNALFAISGNQLQSNGIFDFENKNSYSIRVRTTDQGGLTFEKQLTIGVTNLNETPIDLTLSNTSIAENQAVGTAIGTLTTTDPDTANTFTYSLVTGTGDTDNALFTITDNQLQTNAIFDYETQNSYSIRVRTTDQGGLFFEKELIISATNVNEGTLSFSASQFSINEDGTSLNQITITRTEGSTGEVSVTLNLTDGTATAGSDYDGTPIVVTFADGETQKTVIIPLVDDLIFENDENFNVTLTNPTGGATLGNQTTATVKIIDGGDTQQYASSVIAFSSEWSSSLWSAEQILGQPDTFTYGDIPTSWAPRPRNADGDIDADEFITVGFSTPVYANSIEIRETSGNGFVRSIDLLDSQDAYHSVWVGIDPSQSGEPVNFRVNFERTTYLVVGARINVDIDHNLSTWEEIDSVKLFGVSNYPPTNLNLSNNTIAENQAVATSIGTFTTIDPDADNTFTYSLVTGAGDTDNALFTITDNQLQTNAIFDYETKNSYSIRVRTTDQGGLTFEKQLTITVVDVQPTVTLAVSPSTVNEDGSTNLLYTFTRDNDLGNSLTVNYTIGGTATNGTDYTSIGTSVVFNPGSATATLTIDPTADALVESNETVALTLATGTGYTIGTTTAVTGTITNDDTAIESVGNTKLLKDGTNKYFAQVGNATPIAIKIGGTQISQDMYGANLQTLAVETVNSENQVLWKNTSTNVVSVWKMDSNWNWVSSARWGLNSTEALNQETIFGVDANGDGVIGSPPSITLAVSPASVTEDGTANLVYTFTRTGLTTNALTVNYSIAGTADATDYTGATPGTGKTIIFNPGLATATLTIDPTADAIVEANETVTLTLATGTGYLIGTTTAVTGTITNDDTAIESVGNTKLLKDGTNKYFAQVGNATPIAIKIGGTQISQDMYGANLQTLAVETVNSENQVLWKNTSTNVVSVWKMDSNWNWVSSARWGLNSTEALNQETIFGVDANGDGVIGNPIALTLTGTSGNDTLIGGANNDVLTGLGGKDRLTGGLGSDKFDYKILTDSLLSNFDVITDFTSNDLLVVSTARTGFSNAGVIASLDATAIGNALTTTNFGANSAAQFSFGSRSFVAINNATAGFSQNTDAIIEITGLTGTLGLTNFVTV